ncbi:MAG: efflux RND transporter periplasmic adaptor subunit [Ignavibacteriaceae bacterium]|nr:efflux RND transporter periplasmic adaptor subunit [Ignavibacteriaceae bacterium]
MKLFGFIILSFISILNIGCGNDNNKNSIEATGTIETVDVVLSSKTNGEIIELRKDEGDRVKQGDTVLIIDTETLRLQLKQQEAGAAMSRAQLDLLINGARKEDISLAESSLKEAQVNYDQAKSDMDRLQKLYQTQTITKKQYDDAVSHYDITKDQLSSAKENYAKIKNYARPEEIKQAEAKLNQSLASADLIKKNMNDSYIVSPLNGIVVKKYFEVGETVSPMSSLVKISDLTNVELYIYVTELELGKIKLGQKAEVSVDAFKNKKFDGKVTYISPEAEFTPKNIQTKDERTKLVFAVKIEIPNPDFELKSGMPADARIFFK